MALCLRQDNTLDLDLAHSVVSGDSGFVFEPSHTLAKLLQLASEQRQAASAGPQPLLPEVHVVLKCTERRTDKGWVQLPDEHAVQECPRATLLEVPADDSEKAVSDTGGKGRRKGVDASSCFGCLHALQKRINHNHADSSAGSARRDGMKLSLILLC